MFYNTQTAAAWIGLLLANQISPKIFCKIPIPAGTEIENLLGDVLKKLSATGKEISAENIWLETKMQPILGCYMNICNEIDGRKIAY